MIAIVNTGDVDKDGRTLYRCQINRNVLFTFRHKREDGLAECLKKASKGAIAYEANTYAEWVRSFQELHPIDK